jgi:polysaccharide export outer membrane protein
MLRRIIASTSVFLFCTGLLAACATRPVEQAPAHYPSGATTSYETLAAEPSEALSAQPTPTSASAAVTANPQETEEYQIGPQDLLEVKVFGVEELSRTVRVNNRGFIDLPLVGMVEAAGLTSEELEARIATALVRDFLQDPDVSIFIVEYTSQRVSVGGAVKKPGVYPLRGPTTLLESIATAQGLTDLANPSEVKLYRSVADGKEQVIDWDLSDISAGKREDPFVKGGDRILVAESGVKRAARDAIFFALPFRFLLFP